MKTYKWFFLMLVAGVFTACPSDSEEPLLGNWSVRGSFESSERGHTASFVLELGGKEYGYIACGFNGKICLTGVFQYDPVRDIWTRQAEFPGAARGRAVGFAVNGKGYVGTGWDYRDVMMRDFWEFDPADGGSWKEVAPLPDQPNDPLERHSAVAFTLKDRNGKEFGYVGCGIFEGKETKVFKDFWKFDPDGETPRTDGIEPTYKGKWTKVVGNQGEKRYGGSAFVIDNKAYICLGYSNNSRATAKDLLQFDPNAASEDEIWVPKRKMYNAEKDQDFDDEYGDLARAFAASFTMPGGEDGKMKGYIVSGIPTKTSTWEYDPIEDLWKQRTRYYNSQDATSAREGATGFSFPNTKHDPKTLAKNPNTIEKGRGFVCLGVHGTQMSAWDDVREFFPREEDNIRDDY